MYESEVKKFVEAVGGNKDTIPIVGIEGRIDASNSEELRGRLLEAKEKNSEKVIINAKKLNKITSSGWWALIDVYKPQDGAEIIILDLPTDIREGLKLAGLEDWFTHVSTVESD